MVQQVAWCKWCWIQESVNAILQHLQVVPHHNRTLALRYPHQNLTELGRWNLYWLVNLPGEKKTSRDWCPPHQPMPAPSLPSQLRTSLPHYVPGLDGSHLLGKPMEYRRWSYMTKLWNSPLQTKDLFGSIPAASWYSFNKYLLIVMPLMALRLRTLSKTCWPNSKNDTAHWLDEYIFRCIFYHQIYLL